MQKLVLAGMCCVFNAFSAQAQDMPTRNAVARIAPVAADPELNANGPVKVARASFGRLIAPDPAPQAATIFDNAKASQAVASPIPAARAAKRRNDSGLCESVMDDASLRELVAKEAAAIGVDEKLALTILAAESNDGASVNSDKGARGPMQLMPETAAQYGVRDICNPVENVHGAVLFLKDLSARFSGNLLLVAAAYNAGPERVYQAQGVPAISETVRYVASVTNRYYGLDAPARRPTAKSPHSPSARRASESANGEASGQKWIGGSVLYVSNDGEGEAR